MGGHILLVEDDPDTRDLVREALRKRGFEIEAVGTGEEAIEASRARDPDVVLTDVQLGGMTGIQLATELHSIRAEVPVVVMTAFGNLETAVAAIRAGAYDFITKPISTETLSLTLARAVAHRQLKSEVRHLRDAVNRSRRLENLVGDSSPMRRLYGLIEQVADSDATVLVTGESGTGKELVARAIHARSGRHDGPFVAINCAAMPPTLLESELFGHVKGAFTDAKRSRAGLFVQASTGTLFLDEIGEMPLEMQAKLLRVLQERKVRPVGGDDELAFDTRIVAATNRDLDTEVEEGRFRQDLFYRINVVSLHVPALRSRPADILVLAQHFLERFVERSGKAVKGISAPAAQKLRDYDWPGNVRELENCMERAVTLTRYSEIGVDDLPDRVREYQSTRLVISASDPEEMVTLEEMERRYVRRVLEAVGGNKTQAAKVLGIDRRSLYRRLEKLDGTGGESKNAEA